MRTRDNNKHLSSSISFSNFQEANTILESVLGTKDMMVSKDFL